MRERESVSQEADSPDAADRCSSTVKNGKLGDRLLHYGIVVTMCCGIVRIGVGIELAMRSKWTHLSGMALLALVALMATFAAGESVADADVGMRDVAATLDNNEVTHLVFLREEEKLERDVFAILSSMYPESTVFGHIDDIEQGHTDVMKYLLQRYGIPDPNNNDNLGVFTGKAYGDHFKGRYRYLVGMGSLSELDALYVSAYIEELNMLDIMQCPQVIVDRDNDIDKVDQCGLAYTRNAEIQNIYHVLIEGSKGDLRAYVGAIEAVIGKGAYRAQVMTQQQVDEILER